MNARTERGRDIKIRLRDLYHQVLGSWMRRMIRRYRLVGLVHGGPEVKK